MATNLTLEQLQAACLISQTNRKNALLFNIPPFRYTPISPYNGTVTQSQLDMRRKAEILKYNKSSNGKLTKKQSWTQTVAGNLQRRTYSNTVLKTIANGGSCPDLSTLPTPTSSCDVPGPVMILQYDPSITLYNYSTNTNAYAIENLEETDMWLIKSDTDILSLNPTVFTLNIRKPIDKTVYSYSFSIPVALYISGSSRGYLGVDVSGNFTANVSIDSISVLYGGEPLIINPPTIVQPIISTIVGKSNSYTQANSFNGAIYIGTIDVNNLVLLTNPGNTFDVIFNYSISSSKTNIDTIAASIYTNVGTIFATSDVLENGMKFTTLPSTAFKPPLVLIGS